MRVSLFLFYSAPVGRGTRTASACSFYPGGSSFLHRLRGGTSCVSNTPLMGGRFSLNLSGGGGRCRAPRRGASGSTPAVSTHVCPCGAGQFGSLRKRKIPRVFSRKVPFLIFAKCVHGHIRTIKSGKNFHRFYDVFRHEIDIQQGAQTSVLLCVQSVQGWNEKSNFCIEQSYTVHCDIIYSRL